MSHKKYPSVSAYSIDRRTLDDRLQYRNEYSLIGSYTNLIECVEKLSSVIRWHNVDLYWKSIEIRDEFDTAIPTDVVKEVIANHFVKYTFSYRLSRKHTFRKGPVPYTGHSYRTLWSCSRREFNVKRDILAYESDEDVIYYRVKKPRKASYIDGCGFYNDKRRSTAKAKNWKHYRKTQYKL